jgi:hypothetical protein
MSVKSAIPADLLFNGVIVVQFGAVKKGGLAIRPKSFSGLGFRQSDHKWSQNLIHDPSRLIPAFHVQVTVDIQPCTRVGMAKPF